MQYSPTESIKYVIVLLSFLSASIFPISGLAQHETPSFWSLHLENDAIGDTEDRYYTSGWQISYATPEPRHDFLKTIPEYVPFYAKGDKFYYGLSLGQKIFTPEDIGEAALLVDDRPYAGWLYLDWIIANRHNEPNNRETINTLILTLGVVGPASLGEDSQIFLHEMLEFKQSAGWDNQLENELGLNATFLHKRRRVYEISEARQYEMGLHGGLALGNVYTYASAGIMMRWGTHLENDVGPPSITPGLPGLPVFDSSHQDNWYLFAGIEARAVVHNIFLDGNTNVDSHSVDKEDLVGDLQIGIAYHTGDIRVSLSQVFRSREFKDQDEHSRFGIINFTLLFE